MLIDKLIKTVQQLDLDLRDKTVLTEAASGAYVVTPVLAALAGAKVFAYSRASYYGSVAEVFQNTRKVYQYYDKKLDIEFIDKLTPDVIAQADIITNSGHLRPLDKDKLQYAKDEVVIPLMYEAWEWRDADIDLAYSRARGFRIGATNERHSDVDVFNYLGDMAVKQIFDAGLCLYKNRFVLISNNDFGPYIAKVLSKMCKSIGIIDLPENRAKYTFENADWLGNFPEISIPGEYKSAEAVIFTAYPFNKTWIGETAPILTEKLKAAFNNPYILRYAGDIDCRSLSSRGVKFFPKEVPSGHMGILPSAVGYDPIIRLQAGGLKVGEALISGNYSHNNLPLLELI
jgi:hypothetical protein